MPQRKTIGTRPRDLFTLVTLRKFIQGISLVAFIATLFLTRQDGISPSTSSFLIKVSPLAVFSSMISSRTFLAGSAVAILVFLSSLIVGRAWCGWICPMGTLLDVFKTKKPLAKHKVSEKLRSIKYLLLLVILISALFTNLTLLIFDPITIMVRTFTINVFPLLDWLFTGLERVLLKVPFLAEPIYLIDGWIRPALLPSEPQLFQYSLLVGVFFVAIISLNLVAERFWCRYLCPLGGLLGIPAKLSIVKRRVHNTCSECGLCGSRCPTGTIDADNGFKSDPSECTLCLECKNACFKKSTSFGPRFDVAPLNKYGLSRRNVLKTIGFSILAIGLLATDWIKRVQRNHLIRPPGADQDQFASTCVRCGLCIKICPTHGLQTDYQESGTGGISTPILVPRLGFCQYSCNLCGQVCPVAAIPSMPLDEKKLSVIGKAYIDQNRCIAWSDHQTCIVCEEMCPLPEKAIRLELAEFTSFEGEIVTIQLPKVNRETCIGCGTCEYKCPVIGEAAIRVYTA